LAARISERLKADLIRTEIRVFADGESKIRLRQKITGDRAIIVQSLYPPVDTNLFRALSLISKSRECMTDVTAVIPYMGYARQDMEFLPGEIVTMAVLGKLFKGAGASNVVVVDMHSTRGLELLGANAINVTAVPALARYFADMHIDNPLVVSPDSGGAARAELFASNLGADTIMLDKKRDRNTGQVQITTTESDVARGRNIILVDDMISTGGSIVKAAQFLKSQDCGEMFVACTHALLVDGAQGKIKAAGVSEVVGTNTVPGQNGVVDVSEDIVRKLAAA